MVFQTEPLRHTIDPIDGFEYDDRKSVDARQDARNRVLARIDTGLRGILLEELAVAPVHAEEMTTGELLEELTDQELFSKEGK